jgi:hypothetical protein
MGSVKFQKGSIRFQYPMSIQSNRVEILTAPSSHGASAVGCTPAAHAAYVVPFRTTTNEPSAAVVRSVRVGGGGGGGSSGAAEARSARHEPPELHDTPSEQGCSPVAHLGGTRRETSM